MTVHEAYQQTMYQLFKVYDEREAANIADMVLEHVSGFRKINRIINRQSLLNERQTELLNNCTSQLLLHKPVQYVLHEAWFTGIKFYINENVFIPRPETEELVDWIIKEVPGSQFTVSPVHSLTTYHSPLAVLDIGTGSGCIPVALKKKLPYIEVHALDVSEEALNVAKQNAGTQQTEINFHFLNILDKEAWKSLPYFDILVSNPPYVKRSEAKAMQEIVLQYEPHVALFVPDEDALLFYRTIAEFGLHHLNANGKLFFEINETLGKEVSDLLIQHNYRNVELKKDLQGKDRMIKADVPIL